MKSARRGVPYLARKLAGLRIKEIARHFNRDPITISLGVQNVENLLQRDRELAKRTEIIEENLRKEGKKKYLVTIAQSTRLMMPSQKLKIAEICFRTSFSQKAKSKFIPIPEFIHQNAITNLGHTKVIRKSGILPSMDRFHR